MSGEVSELTRTSEYAYSTAAAFVAPMMACRAAEYHVSRSLQIYFQHSH